MSFLSQRISGSHEIAIVGQGWPALVMAASLVKLNEKPFLLLKKYLNPKTQGVFIGNGETESNALKIYGSLVFEALWGMSRDNFEMIKSSLKTHGTHFWDKGSYWYDLSNSPLRGAGLCFDVSTFEAKLLKYLLKHEVPIETIVDNPQLKITSPFGCDIHYKKNKMRSKLNALIVIVISDQLAASIASMASKLIPVTLSSFSVRTKKEHPFSLAFFHGGADFAFSEPGGFRIGSFRNLYEDSAVGIRKHPDLNTLQHLKKFFCNLGWVHPTSKWSSHLSVESISCDGLPLVGTLPDAPGVFVVCGFAGRMQNFIFSVSEELSLSLLGGHKLGRLSCFSTKRFA